MAIAVVLLVQFGAAPESAWAQTGTLGNVIGKAADETGGVLPGVTVTATSPALQVPSVTTVTDAEGNYRLRDLPAPGMYRVVFELPGFQSIAFEGVNLTAGFTARLDPSMKVSTVSETVEVSGQSPVVDTVSVSGVSSIQLERLEATPLGLGCRHQPAGPARRRRQPTREPAAHRDVRRRADADAGIRRHQFDDRPTGEHGALSRFLSGRGSLVQDKRQQRGYRLRRRASADDHEIGR
jgi:hypothetical protein